MNISDIILIIYEGAFILAVFLISLLFATMRGRQFMINVIYGLYFGLLFTLVSPLNITNNTNELIDIWINIGIFTLATVTGSVITSKLMPISYRESVLESLGKKIFLSSAVTLLIILFSFHVIPVEKLIAFNSFTYRIFSDAQIFFLWLFVPFLLLYFHK